MFTVGYFPTSSSPAGDGEGDEELKRLQEDVRVLKAWRDLVVPLPYRTSTAAWNDLVTSLEMQSHVGLEVDTLQTNHIQPLQKKVDGIQPICFSTNLPDDQLVTEAKMIMALFAYPTHTDLDQAKQRILNLELVQPVYTKVLQPGPGQWITPTNNSSRVRPNGVYLCDVWSGYAGLVENLFMFHHPLESVPFQIRVVNGSLNNIALRMYCVPTEDGTTVLFRRETKQNHTYSCVSLAAGRTLRLVFIPANYQWFVLNGTPVAGFLEFDEEADPSRTVLPTNV